MKSISNGRSRKVSKGSNGRKEQTQPLKRIPVCAPDGPRRSPIEFIKVKDVRYYFTMKAVQRGLISSRGVGTYPYHSVIYLRTADGVYRSRFRSMRTLLDRLPARYALKANHGIVVNPSRIDKLDPWARKKEAIFFVENRTAKGDKDWIWLSRGATRQLIDVLSVQDH